MFPAFFLGMILRKYDIWWKEKVILLLFISLFIYVISIVIRHNYVDMSHIIRMITGLLVPLCGSLFIISLFYAMRNYIKMAD